jgi:hypothetical protein
MISLQILQPYIKRFVAGLVFILLVVAFSTIHQHTTYADTNTFNAGHIIDDAVFTNSNTLGITQIQQFLNSKVPTCDTNGTQPASEFGYPNLTHAQYAAMKGWAAPPYTCLKDYSENGLTSAQIIFNAAQQYQVNPEVLIVLLQKEQGLVTDTWPLPSEYTSATGYACPDNGSCSSQYYGLTNQIDNAAYMYHAIMTQNPDWYSPYIVGNNYISYFKNATDNGTTCGGSTVNITNLATAALYDYTPYQPNAAALAAPMGTTVTCGAYGNLNFFRYFTSWFGVAVMPVSNISIPGGTYSIQNQNSSSYLDVANGSSTPGAQVWIYRGDGTAAENWLITPTSSGYYSIQNVGTHNYLDVTNGNLSPGAKLQSWTGNGSCSQQWAATYQNGSYEFLNACSGLALDIPGGGTADGTQAQLWSNNQTAAQNWNLISHNPAPATTGLYNLANNSSLVMDTVGSQTTSGTITQLSTSISSLTQIWHLALQPDGTYTIRNATSGLYLGVIGASTTNGTNIQLATREISTCAQKWTIANSASSTYALLSACSGLAIDMTGGAISTPGTLLQVYTANGTGSQQWSLNPIKSGIPSAVYSIQSLGGLALDITGGNVSNGTKTQLWNINGTIAQQWQITKLSDGNYSIENPTSSKYLDVTGGAVSVVGTPTQIWPGNSTCSQEWDITESSDLTYNLQPACSNLSLDIAEGAITQPGVQTRIWSTNGTNSQKWLLGNP